VKRGGPREDGDESVGELKRRKENAIPIFREKPSTVVEGQKRRDQGGEGEKRGVVSYTDGGKGSSLENGRGGPTVANSSPV